MLNELQFNSKRFAKLPHIRTHIHTPMVVSGMQGNSQLIGGSWGQGVLLRDTATLS